MTREKFLRKHLANVYVQYHEEFKSALDALLQAERKQTLERAAKAMCGRCANKRKPPERVTDGTFYHRITARCSVWCVATPIHALIAELPKAGTALPKGEPERGAETPSSGEMEP